MAAKKTTSTRNTAKKSSPAKTAKSAARKATGAARDTATAARQTAGLAGRTASKAAGRAGKAAGTAARKASGAASKTANTAARTARKATGAAGTTASTAKKTASKATSSARKATGATKSRGGAAASRAGTARGRATSARGGARGRGPDALQLLIDDHRTVEDLFKRFENSGKRANKSRQDIAQQIIEELSVHAVIEEQAFYPAVRAQVPGAEDVVLESLEEHHVVKWTLSELEKMAPEDERFEAKMTVLMESVRHHVKEEEKEMFPKVRRSLDREQLEAIGEALAEAKQVAPRRPHPRSPDTPPGNMIAAAVTAPFDAARSVGESALNQVRNLVDRARTAGEEAVSDASDN